MSPGRGGLPGDRSCSGTGRAEITGSREGAKLRNCDKKRIIFRLRPRAASVVPLAGQGQPGPQTPSSRRARAQEREGAGLRGRMFRFKRP